MGQSQFQAADLVGTVVDDRFEILARLGEGGMGAVYKARQISMDRIVALKILLHDQRGDPISVERFRHEAYLASRLNHPNAIVIHDFGQSADGLLYIAMEFLEGETLRERLDRGGQLSVKSALGVASQTLRVLAEAHRMGLIHRDIKPDNIFLTSMEGDPDFVKVLDFGIAKLTEVQDGFEGYQGGLTVKGKIHGTPKYMSPEQIRGKTLDLQSDLYSFGVVLYELLTGRLPFVADTPVDVMMAHLRDPPPSLTMMRPDIPVQLENVVLRALEKDRRLRYQNGDEFLEAVENFKFNSGFYAVPARVANRLSETAQQPGVGMAPPLAAPSHLPNTMMLDAMSPFAGPPDDEDEDVTLMGAQLQAPPPDERTVMEFEESLHDERTVFESEEQVDQTANLPPDDAEVMDGSVDFLGESALFIIDEISSDPDAMPVPAIGRALESGPSVQDEATVMEFDEPEDPGESSKVVPIPHFDDSLSGVSYSPGAQQRKHTLLGGPGAPPPVTPAPAPAPPAVQRPAPAPAPPRPAHRTAPKAVARAAAPVPSAFGQASPTPTPAPRRLASQPQVRPISQSAPRPAPKQPMLRSTPAGTAPPARLVDAVRGQASPPSAQATNPKLVAPRSKKPLIIIAISAVLATAAAVVFFVVKPFDKAGEPAEGKAAAVGPPVLNFASEPTGVEIFHDNRFIGETPLEHTVPAGMKVHKLQLATKTSTFRVEVPAVEGPAWVYVRLPKGKGKLGHVLVNSTPPGAAVKVADTPVGKTPLYVVAADQSAVELVLEQGGQSKPASAKAAAAGGRVDVPF